MAKQKFSYDSIQDVSSVRRYLKTLIRSIDEGKIALNSEEESIELHPKGLLHFSIEARKKGRKNKLTLELSWTDKKELRMDDETSKPVKKSS
nr:amphi-Trp domain-containing protein [uncultured Desulfobulbus sp.]